MDCHSGASVLDASQSPPITGGSNHVGRYRGLHTRVGWTGFLGKTLWDWMELLIVPVILALGGLLITQMDRLNSARAQQLERERLELDRRQTQEQLALAQRGQISERFSRAVDQITSAFLSVRLGGIYSLERTAREDRDYHWPIMELLTNYVRGHVPINARPPTPATDIQACLTVIGRRSVYNRDAEYGPIDLHDTHLQGADSRRAYLQWANLSEANLSEANLSGADLDETNLNDATLFSADLSGAKGWTEKQLTAAKSLEEATMPNGQKYEDWLKSKGRGEDGQNSGLS